MTPGGFFSFSLFTTQQYNLRSKGVCASFRGVLSFLPTGREGMRMRTGEGGCGSWPSPFQLLSRVRTAAPQPPHVRVSVPAASLSLLPFVFFLFSFSGCQFSGKGGVLSVWSLALRPRRTLSLPLSPSPSLSLAHTNRVQQSQKQKTHTRSAQPSGAGSSHHHHITPPSIHPSCFLLFLVPRRRWSGRRRRCC